MKVAFVCLYEAYPPISGAAYVTYNCARLTPCTGLLVQFSERAAVEHVANLTIVSLRQQAASRFQKLLCMPRAFAQICKEIASFTPDHIVIEGASWAVYLMILVFALRKTLPTAKIVYHAHNVEYMLRQERSGRLVVAVTRYAEKQLLLKCDRAYAVSQQDCQHFSSLYGVMPDLLPNGVDCGTNRPTSAEIDEARRKFGLTEESILFIGLYAYPPNTEAVRFLVERVMPRLYEQRPNVRLVITGGGPECSPPWLIKTGVIPRKDLDAILCASSVGVAPIFKGSGTRLKILEYMASRIPVVATRKGAEGLNLEGEKHVLYAETAAEFQSALLRLLCDQALSQRLSTEAATLVKSKFDWVLLLRTFASQLENQA